MINDCQSDAQLFNKQFDQMTKSFDYSAVFAILMVFDCKICQPSNFEHLTSFLSQHLTQAITAHTDGQEVELLLLGDHAICQCCTMISHEEGRWSCKLILQIKKLVTTANCVFSMIDCTCLV
jgi:hypothetical protein